MSAGIELKRYVLALWRWAWLIALATALAGGLSYQASSQTPRVYQSTTTLLVGQYLRSTSPTQGDIQLSQQLAQGYVPLARSQPVLQRTIDALGLNTTWDVLAGRVSATAPQQTAQVRITVADTNPQRAKAIADEVAQQLILESPTPLGQDLAERSAFVNEQLSALREKIDRTQALIDELETQLDLETSALAIQDLQRQIDANGQKISTWQRNYTDLLNSLKGSTTNYLSVIEPASVPTTPIGSSLLLNVLLAASIGLVLSVGATLLMEWLDNPLRTVDDVARVIGLPVIGSIGRLKKIKAPADALITLREPDAPAVEAYRLLRNNVEFACLADGHRVTILVTSSGAREGKSVTAANLAAAFALARKQTVLVDADLRNPSISALFGLTNRVGLASLLLVDSERPLGQYFGPGAVAPQSEASGEPDPFGRRVEECLVPTPLPTLRILHSGPAPANPADLLAGRQLDRVLRSLEALAEVVIVDSPPLLPLADSGVLAARVGRVVLVVDSGKTRPGSARLAQEILGRANARVLGVVLNNARGGPLAGYHRYLAARDESRVSIVNASRGE